MKPTPAPGLANLCDRLVSLYRKSPQAYHAISRRVTDGLTAKASKSRARSVQVPRVEVEKEPARNLSKAPRATLMERLRAVHLCAAARQDRRCLIPNPAGFVQLPTSASGARAWRCEGCGAVVTLDKS